MKGLKYITIPFLILLSAINANSEVIILNDSITQFVSRNNNKSSYRIFIDSTGILPFETLLGKDYQHKFFIERSLAEPKYHSDTSFTYWCKFMICNKSRKHLNFLLLFNEVKLSSYDVTIFSSDGFGGYNKTEIGTSYTYQNSKHISVSKINSIITLPTDSTITFYLKFRIKRSSVFDFTIQNMYEFTNDGLKKTMTDSIVFGILFIMILYHLFIYFSIRDKTYLFYIFLVVSYILFDLYFKGFAFQYLWPNLPWWEKHCHGFISHLPFVMFVLFVRSFLKTKNKQPFNDKILILLMSISLIEMFVSIFIIDAHSNFVHLFLNIYSISFILFALLVGIISLKSGFRPARFYILALVFLIFSLILFNLRMIGVIPSIYMVTNMLDVGFVSFITLFALSLGDRMNMLKKEKWEAERKAMKLLETKVQERTLEIAQKNVELMEQKEEIETQRDEIAAQKDEIMAQRDYVTEQKQHIEKIHENLTSSIQYAERIQNAVLPNEQTLKNKIQGLFFILFKPKDIVSGDFYFVERRKHWLLMAVADCTGHGVPGALMSMLGISFLNEIVAKDEIQSASQVLDELRQNMIHSLQQKGISGEQKDGMDISFVAVNTLTYELQFAGANNPLYLIRADNQKELIEIKGDSMPASIHEVMNHFTNHIIQLQKGDMIYLKSDGYEDQFGGPNGKKYLSKNLKQLLQENCQKTMEEQKKILDTTIENWKNNFGKKYEQTDDITILGIRFTE